MRDSTNNENARSEEVEDERPKGRRGLLLRRVEGLLGRLPSSESCRTASRSTGR